jgi:hypothetical protein
VIGWYCSILDAKQARKKLNNVRKKCNGILLTSDCAAYDLNRSSPKIKSIIVTKYYVTTYESRTYDSITITNLYPSGVARICIWRGLGARSATGTASGAFGASGRAGGGSGRGLTPSRKGVRGYHPRENFRNLTTLMCILDRNFHFCAACTQLNLIQRKSELL